MKQKLVILESPNKVEKVKHYLGAGYEVMATAGHFRDLPERGLGVDISTFTPEYVVDSEKSPLLVRIKARAREAEQVLLATDADREGEAISWHLAQELRLRQPMRLKYTEITEKALRQAASRLVPLDQNLVDAQQARRVLDRLVGYQVSPMLSKRFGNGQSAGRVQSATLHLVVLREVEREAFRSEPYWTLSAIYERDGKSFQAKYATIAEDGKLSDTRFNNEAEANAIAYRARGARHVVAGVETKPVESRPSAPFTTSTLQQAASSRLHLKPDHTMSLAQKLFEQGILSYHRTDSVALSDDAIEMARQFLAHDYPEALPSEPVKYKVKADAQGAHEAIRPTSLSPEASCALIGDELALYQLIRNRFIACQCKPAVLDRTIIAIQAADTAWRAMGSVVAFESWRRYVGVEPAEANDGKNKDDQQEDEGAQLPKVTQGEILNLIKIANQTKKTTPPGRYTQASLIAAMEKCGIGRPSTYATTVKTLFERGYVGEEKKQVFPTTHGRRIDAALAQAFPELLETTTTAELEQRLDEIADGRRQWKEELGSWYGPFSKRLAAADAILDQEIAKYPELAQQTNGSPRPAGRDCPRCGRPLLIRNRKDQEGEFLACSGYKPAAGDPKSACSYSADLNVQSSLRICPVCSGPMEEIPEKYARCIKANCKGRIDLAPTAEEKCPVCSAPMRDKGDFLSCSKYPQCKGSYDKKGLKRAKKNESECPDCGSWMVERRGVKGLFLACSAYPRCKHSEPIPGRRQGREVRK